MRRIDADALRDDVMDIWGGGTGSNTVIYYGDVLAIIDEAPTAQPETGWISVKDRLPEGDGLVLAIANGKPQKNITLKSVYVLAEYIADDGWILDLWPMWKHAKVTHWMPLPEPPKENDNGN